MVAMLSTSLTACGGDDDDNDNATLSDQILYAGDSVKIKSNATVDNRFVAYVSNNGYLHGFHVGETTASANGKSAKITVRGRYNAFDVQTDWGASSELVKANQKNGTLRTENTSDGVHMLIYQNVGTANILAYGFRNNKLYIAIASSSPSDEDEIINYLKERYIFMPEEVASYTFAGIDGLDRQHASTLAIVKLDSDYKYDYMLQTIFVSIDDADSQSSVKAFGSKVGKMMKR